MAVGDLARRPVHRVDGVLAQRAGVVLGVPLPRRVRLGGPGRRVQRGHQLQTGHGGGAARRHHPRGVHAQDPGELRRRKLSGLAPVPGVQRVPRRDAQLDAGPLRAGGGAVDPRPRTKTALGQLPLHPGELLDDLVALRQTPGEALLLRERGGQTVALEGGLGEDDERVGVLTGAGELRLTELGLAQRPVDQGRDALGGYVQDQAAGAVRQHRAVVLDVDDRQRAVLEVRIGAARRGAGRGRLLRTRAARRRRRPGGARRTRRGRRSSGDRGRGLGVLGCSHDRSLGRLPCGQSPRFRRGGRTGERGRHQGSRLLRRCRCRVELRELPQQPGVRLTLRAARLGRLLHRLPSGHRGPPHLQCASDVVQRQTVRDPQPFALLRRWQRRAGRDQRVDRIEQLGHGTPPDRHSTPRGVSLAYFYRTDRVRIANRGSKSGPGQGRAGNRRVTPGPSGEVWAVACSE